MRRCSCLAASLLGFAFALSACTKGESGAGSATPTQKAVNLLTWSGTISPATISRFEAQTGIKLRVSYATSNEDMETRLMTGHSGFDVVTPAADYLQREVQAGVYLPLIKAKLPHLSNLDSQLMQKVAAHDPQNAHATILMWGTNGIAAALGRTSPVLIG